MHNLFDPHSSEEYVIASMSIIMNTKFNTIKKKLNVINALNFDSKTECLVFSTNKLTTYVTPSMYKDRNKSKLPSIDDVTIIFYSRESANSAILLGLSHGCLSLIIPSDTESYVYTNILPVYENYFTSISLKEQPIEQQSQEVPLKAVKQPIEQQLQEVPTKAVKQPIEEQSHEEQQSISQKVPPISQEVQQQSNEYHHSQQSNEYHHPLKGFSIYKSGSCNTNTYSIYTRYKPYHCNSSSKSSNIVKKSSVL